MFEVYNNQYIYEIINDELNTMMNTFGDEMEQKLNNNDDDDGDWKNLCDYELELDRQQQSTIKIITRCIHIEFKNIIEFNT